MRLFLALDLDDAIRLRIARFLQGVRDFAPAARWVREESLHVTLKFIGERPEATVPLLERALASLRMPVSRSAFAATASSPLPGPPGCSGLEFSLALNCRRSPRPSMTSPPPSTCPARPTPSAPT